MRNTRDLEKISGELSNSATAILAAMRLLKREGHTVEVAEVLASHATKLEQLAAALRDAATP